VEIEVVVAILAGVETVMDTAADVDAEKVASPEYAAVMECEPTASPEVLNVAAPDEFTVPVPIWVAPSLKVTLPVGTPDLDFGATVAVKVTVWPDPICKDDAERVVVVATGADAAGVKTKTVAEYAGKL
jgi:hypothetical protein